MEQKIECGIYKIENIITGRQYIGGSQNVKKRLREHRSYLQKHRHHCKALQEDFDKFGDGSFKYILIEICSIENLRDREQFYLDTTESKYNTFNNARGAHGFKFDKEVYPNRILNHGHRGKFGKKHFHSQEIYQYDINGNFIRKWYGFHEIERELGFKVSNVHAATTRNGTSYGFIWLKTFHGNKIKQKKEGDSHNRCKPIGIYNKDGEIVKVFWSRKEICQYFGWKCSRSIKETLLRIPKRFKEFNLKEISHEEYNQNIHLAFQSDEIGNQ